MLKKLIVVLLLSFVVLGYFLFNRRASIEIPDIYEDQIVNQIIDEPDFIDSTKNALGYGLVAENNFLKLFLKENTTQFAVVDKRNDYVWYSSVYTSDATATKTFSNLQKSTFSVRYLETDNTSKLLTNYEFSIANGQYEIDYDAVEDGFRINYTIADHSPQGHWFPTKISKDRFTELVLAPFYAYVFDDQMYKDELTRYIRNAYVISESDPETYVLALVTGDKTSSDLVGTDVSYLFEIMYEIGYYGNLKDEEDNYIEEYTLDDVGFDNEVYEYFVDLESPEFFIPMEVKLNEDNLEAYIVNEEIISKAPYQIVSIQFLPYMGAANTSKEGYMVIPEGSGGLINFNNGKVQQRSYSTNIYGTDHTIIPNELEVSDTGAKLPIYGLKHEDNAFLTIIESGAEHVLLTAEISGKNDRFNKVIPEFIFKNSGLYYLTTAGISIWNDDQYSYQPKLKFYFLADEEANYNSMALLYGKYIEQKYQLEPLTSSNKELYLDILGSYDFNDYFLFFPYKHVETLTTYQQAEAMIDELKTEGIPQFVINYKGWFNQGMDHELPNNIDLDRSIGSKKAMNAFVEEMNTSGYPLYFDVDFIKLYDKPAFYSDQNIARIVGGTLSEIYPYDTASRLQDKTKDPFYYLNTQAIAENMDGFLKDFSKLSANGLYLRNFGEMIYSDFYRKDGTYRYQIVDYMQDLLANTSKDQTMMISSANAYTLPFVNHLTDLPVVTSNYLVIDDMIPFYQLAIAGKINYSMPSINLNQAEDDDYYLLKALETGSNLKFTISYQDTSVLIQTKYNTYFSTEFSLVKDSMIHLETTIENLIGPNNYLVKHEILGPNTVQVTYSNGTIILLDYQMLTYTVIE